jgi:DNA-binding IclR family transcriptional regulator
LARPALSASRSLDVIDLLAAFPGRSFSLSEIAGATEINIASCHAILLALLERGYLARGSRQKTYSLGPTLAAVGESAIKAQPLIASSKAAARRLFNDLQIPVLLSGLSGNEVLGIVSIADATGRGPGLNAGQRVPLIPPAGAPFLAWSSDDAKEAWIASGVSELEVAQDWRVALDHIKRRGFQLNLRPPGHSGPSPMMTEMALGVDISHHKDRLLNSMRKLDYHPTEPEEIDPAVSYDVVLIASPIFGSTGEALFNLCLGGFTHLLSGAVVLQYADRLMHACLDVMRAHRERE